MSNRQPWMRIASCQQVWNLQRMFYRFAILRWDILYMYWLVMRWHKLRCVLFLAPRRSPALCLHQGYRKQCTFSLGAAWPRWLFLSTLYHLNLLRITSASGGRRMGDSCCGYKVTDQHSRLSTLRSSKRLTENMVVQLLGHEIDHKIPKCVSGLWGYWNLHSHKPWLLLLCYF